ncbi:hypothetical protein H8J86_07835 [Clostridium perfringens]|uniref:hypothetical protein n=1 Tax=Clostridium perfringens TaxID=1502 RepID=UPI0018E4AD8F|nr:hypothetical protein [Clostridium perfringens]MBI6005861.1 hypothetical protein [Clostridium perfringens]
MRLINVKDRFMYKEDFYEVIFINNNKVIAKDLNYGNIKTIDYNEIRLSDIL